MSKANPVENDTKDAIKKLLDRHGWHHWPVAASRFGVGGLSDRMAIRGAPGLGCIFMAIEAKKGSVTKATALQSTFLGKVRAAGGIGIVVNADRLARFEALLEAISLAYPLTAGETNEATPGAQEWPLPPSRRVPAAKQA